jgi:hypothetical protein
MQTRVHSKRLFFPLVTAVLLAAGCSGKIGDSASSSLSLPAWEPDAKLMEELGPVAILDGYEVRPPRAYTLNPPPPNGSTVVKGFYWAGVPRGDQTAPHFLISLKSASPEGGKDTTLEDYFREMLEGFHRRRANWTQTSPERGQINGLTFMRVYWSGTDADTQRKRHGVMYAGKDGSTLFFISSQDAEPHHERALKLAETAALTFKRK